MPRGHKAKPNAILKVGEANPERIANRKQRIKTLKKAARARRHKYSKKMFREALIASHGIITHAAQRLGCTRMTIMKALDRYPDLDEELQSIKESYVDLAESSLLAQVSDKNTQATIFLLRSLGRNRGWIDSPQQHIHAVAPIGSGTWMDIMKRAMESGELKRHAVLDIEAITQDDEDPRETALRLEAGTDGEAGPDQREDQE